VKYLERLRAGAQKIKNVPGGAPTEPTKPPFVSFAGSSPGIKNNIATSHEHLAEFRASLDLGNLVICARCKNFTTAKGLEIGDCRLYGEVWGTVPFWCRTFEPSTRRDLPRKVQH
jgi:hypothetical protein